MYEYAIRMREAVTTFDENAVHVSALNTGIYEHCLLKISLRNSQTLNNDGNDHMTKVYLLTPSEVYELYGTWFPFGQSKRDHLAAVQRFTLNASQARESSLFVKDTIAKLHDIDNGEKRKFSNELVNSNAMSNVQSSANVNQLVALPYWYRDLLNSPFTSIGTFHFSQLFSPHQQQQENIDHSRLFTKFFSNYLENNTRDLIPSARKTAIDVPNLLPRRG